MINVIVPLVEKPQEYLSMISEISKNRDCVIYVGVLNKFKDLLFPKNVIVKYYKDNSGKEEIINSLHSIKKEVGKILVIRRPLKNEEFTALISSKGDICYLKKPKSRFSRWWANIWKKLIKKIFAFYYFEDISAILFQENIFNLINSLTNLSYITRIDRFVGLKQEEVASVKRSPKRDYDKFDAYSRLVGWTLFFVLMLLISIIISSSFKPVAIMVLVSILLCTIGIMAVFMAILNFVRTLYVGKLRHGRAEECLNK